MLCVVAFGGRAAKMKENGKAGVETAKIRPAARFGNTSFPRLL